MTLRKQTRYVLIVVGSLLLAAASGPVAIEEELHEHAVKPMESAQALSPELRQLLIMEMRQIDEGMGELLSAIAAGDWETIETISSGIQHSFILKQKLTDPQRHELHEKLPDEFLRMDVLFHETAGKLASIAPHRSTDLATFYYSRLVEGCVNCHARFAPERFPGLTGEESEEHQH